MSKKFGIFAKGFKCTCGMSRRVQGSCKSKSSDEYNIRWFARYTENCHAWQHACILKMLSARFIYVHSYILCEKKKLQLENCEYSFLQISSYFLPLYRRLSRSAKAYSTDKIEKMFFKKSNFLFIYTIFTPITFVKKFS